MSQCDVPNVTPKYKSGTLDLNYFIYPLGKVSCAPVTGNVMSCLPVIYIIIINMLKEKKGTKYAVQFLLVMPHTRD